MTNEEIKKEEEKYLDGLEHKISDHDLRVKELAMRLIDDDFDESISFGLIGKSDTLLIGTDMFIDGNQVVNNFGNEALFIIGNALNKLRFEYFKYFKNEISGTKDIKIVFHLKSITGFKYKEIVELRFEEIEDNEKTYWGLNKYKIHFKF